MDGSQFDRWTRRRFGLAAGGILATLFGATTPRAEARKTRRKKRCAKLGYACRSDSKRKCCKGLTCDLADLDSGAVTVCCRSEGRSCQTPEDCCRDFVCPNGLCELPSSDHALKANFATVDPTDMLERVRDLRISTWNYTFDDPSIRHIRPMAQDFAAAFGVGADDRHIHPIDAQGVALAAIQGLGNEIESLRAGNARLAARLRELETRLMSTTQRREFA
jgi:hypothetical protein